MSIAGNSMDLVNAILADPEAFVARKAELESLAARADARLQLVGIADEIPLLHQRAAELQHEAAERLGAATEKAKQILEQAELDAAHLLRECSDKVNASLQQAGDQLSEARNKSAEANELLRLAKLENERLAMQAADLDQQRVAVEEALQAARQAQARHDAKRATLEAAQRTVVEALSEHRP